MSMIAVAISAAVTGSALAGVTNAYATSNYDDWREAGGIEFAGYDPTASLFGSMFTMEYVETFSSLQPGNYPFVNGDPSTDWWAWTAQSGAGESGSVEVVYHYGDTLIYSNPARSALEFTFDGPTEEVRGFTGGLRGIGGGFRFFNAAGDSINGKLTLTLSTGERLIRNFNSDDSFGGFWLTDPNVVITSLKLEPFGSSGGANFVGATNLFMGYAGVTAPIPAPGAVALLAAAGLIGYNRRR
jgi:hypothetical protein